MRNKRALLVTFAVLVVINAPMFALAAGLPTQIVPTDCNQAGGCKSVCDLATIAQNVLNTGIYIAVVLSAVLFAWAGVMYLTNVANPQGVTRAKSVFFNVVVGLIIILVAWLLVDTLMKVFVGGSFGPWNSVC